jgi:predicted PurR-regulated permease PerM
MHIKYAFVYKLKLTRETVGTERRIFFIFSVSPLLTFNFNFVTNFIDAVLVSLALSILLFLLCIFFHLFFVVLLFLPKFSLSCIQNNPSPSFFLSFYHQFSFLYTILKSFRLLVDHDLTTYNSFNRAAGSPLSYITDYILIKYC